MAEKSEETPMSKELLDLITEASRIIAAAQVQESVRSTCTIHGAAKKR